MISPRVTQKIAWGVMWASAAIAIGSLLFIIGYVFYHGIPQLSFDFVFGETRDGGLRAPLVGTIFLVALLLIIVAPLGIGAAIYLSEYAPRNKLTDIIRYALDTLAGIPSIIFGLFGVALFVTYLFQKQCLLAGALTMACLTLPFMVGAAQEALKSVPQSAREASYALGATKWQTIRRVVLPVAMPGIITGIILCVGTAIAETAPLLATSGFSAFTPDSPFDPVRTLSLHLYHIATEAPATKFTRDELNDQAMGVGAILIIVLILLNLSVRWLSNRYIRKTRGE